MEAHRFDDWAGYRAALLNLLDQAPTRLDWLDDDLSETGIGTLAVVEHLASLFAVPRNGSLRLLVLDPAWLQARCPRTVSLFQTWGHRVEVRVCDEADHPVDERFLLGNTTVVRRFHPDSPRGELTAEGQKRALCQQRFDALWHGAAPISISRPLGL